MRYRQFQKLLRADARIPVTVHEGLAAAIAERLPVSAPVARSIPVFRRIAITLSVALGVFAIFLGGFLGLDTDIVVTLDANPSIEIEINHFNRVIAVNALNPDAEAVIATIDHPRGNPETVVRDIYDALVAGGYIETTDAFLLFGISGTDAKSGSRLEAAFTATLADATLLYMNSYDSSSLSAWTVVFKSAEAIYSYISPEMNSDIESAVAGNDVITTTAAAWTTIFSTAATTTMDGVDTSADGITTGYDGTGESCYLCSYTVNMDASELAQIAANLGITEAKLRLVIAVFNGYPIYQTQSDLESLVAMPISELAVLYQALP